MAHLRMAFALSSRINNMNYQGADSSSMRLSAFFLGIWALYLFLSPFYIFPKGMPQPADFILALGIGSAFIKEYVGHPHSRIKIVYLIGMLFVGLTMFINFMNYLFYPDPRLLLTMLYYPYNFSIFLFVIWLFTKDPSTMIRVTVITLTVTVLTQIAFTFSFDSGFRGYRGTAGFENPNQLAYWALLSAAMVVFLRRGTTLKPIDFTLLFLFAFLESLALSKAGIIAYTIFFIFLFLTPKVSRNGYILGLIVVFLTTVFLMFQPATLERIYNSIEPLQNVTKRIEGIGDEPDDNPEARGYYRIVQFPYYTLVGAGEGAFYRFDPHGYNKELHSGVATIIFSYGILGTILFGSFLGLIFLRQPWYYILLFAPIMAFGLPHQSFRFAHFWVFLGICYGLFLVAQKHKQKGLSS